MDLPQVTYTVITGATADATVKTYIETGIGLSGLRFAREIADALRADGAFVKITSR